MRRYFMRIIQDGCIRYQHRRWQTHGDVAHLEGMKLVFAHYAPSRNDLLCLWGTPELYMSDDTDSEESKLAWHRMCELFGKQSSPATMEILPSGSYMMEQRHDGEFTAYQSRGIEWWEPIP